MASRGLWILLRSFADLDPEPGQSLQDYILFVCLLVRHCFNISNLGPYRSLWEDTGPHISYIFWQKLGFRYQPFPHQWQGSIASVHVTTERRDVLGCTSPTTKRFPEAQEMSWGPREISRSEGRGCTTHSLIISREGLILTLSILPCLEGWISWSL